MSWESQYNGRLVCCLRHRKHATKEQAGIAMKRLQQKQPDDEFSIWHCFICGRYHVGRLHKAERANRDASWVAWVAKQQGAEA